MKRSTNNNLMIPESGDQIKDIFNVMTNNFDVIDNGLSKFYVATLNSANVYKVTTGLSKTSLGDSYSIKVAIPSASTGAVSIIVDSCSAVPVLDSNLKAITNFKANSVYTLTYYKSNFICASGGDLDCSAATASETDVLASKKYIGSDGNLHTGSIVNKGAVTGTLGANGTLSYPAGYYSSLKVTQSLTTKGATTWTPKTSNQTIAAGTYLSGAQTIAGDADLVAANIISGKNIFGVAGNAKGVISKSGTTSAYTLNNYSLYIDLSSVLSFKPDLISIRLTSGIIYGYKYAINNSSSGGSSLNNLFMMLRPKDSTCQIGFYKYFAYSASNYSDGLMTTSSTDAIAQMDSNKYKFR